MIGLAQEKNERLHAARGQELGALLARLHLEGEDILFEGRFMFMIMPRTVVVQENEDPRRYLLPYVTYTGKMGIHREIDDVKKYRIVGASVFHTTFEGSKEQEWRFNLSEPQTLDHGNFFLSFQLGENSGLYEARFYSRIGINKTD